MKWSKVCWWLGGVGALGAAVLNIPVPRKVDQPAMSATIRPQRLDLSGYASTAPPRPLDLLFIHHSCGGQLLAPPGPPEGTNSICRSDPNGGNLRPLLEKQGYRVHEASYGSRIGEDTDLFDWLPKFRAHMDSILRCEHQDSVLPDGRTNRVVMFKSCFPNSAFRDQGAPPGDAAGPELTVYNAKATYNALLQELRKQPDVLFVCVTAPPLAPGKKTQPLWRQMARKIKATITGTQFDLAGSGRLAREFNNWLTDVNGWLRDYPLHNVVVFDYYDILTDNGESNLSRYPTWDGSDSHPSRGGNEKAAQAFVPFVNRAARRAGIVE